MLVIERGVAYWNGTCFGNKNKVSSILTTATFSNTVIDYIFW